MHDEAGVVSPSHQRRRRHQGTGRVAGQDQPLARADAIGVRRDLGEPRRRDEVAVAARPTRRGKVIRAARRTNQLHERDPQVSSQQAQVGGLEGLDDHPAVGNVQAVDLEALDERFVVRQPDRGKVGRALRLGIDADLPTDPCRLTAHEVDDLLQRRHRLATLVPPVQRTQGREPLSRPQRAQLGQGEVLAEPAADTRAVDRLGGAPVRKLQPLRHIGRTAEFVLVAGHQHTVRGDDEIRLDVVGAERDRQPVRAQGVLGAVAAGRDAR